MSASGPILDRAATRDGIGILTRRWPVPAGTPVRAVALLVHGLGEHSGRYGEVAEPFTGAGFETFAWDHRGFGASDGERAWVDPWSRFHDDVEDRLAASRAAVPDVPAILYGHSLGGLIALGYVLSGRAAPDLLVLSAPALGDNVAAWKHVVGPIAGRLVPHLRFPNGIPEAMLSRDPAQQAATRADPLMVRASTARFGALAFVEQARVRSGLASLRTPTLVIHGLDDPVVPQVATAPLADVPRVTRRTYPGLRHELHHEPEGRQVYADVVAWLTAALESGVPSAGN